VRAALGSGALGYVLKSELASDLVPCLREVLLDHSFVSPSIGW
jgi:DNA-binding NarL/FixJ family response regulator